MSQLRSALRSAAGLSGLALLAACASHPAAAPGATPAPATAAAAPSRAPVRHSPTLITRDELTDATISSLNVLEAVRHLRPSFFNYRGHTSSTDPDAGSMKGAIDGGGVLDLQELSSVRVSEVLEIRLLTASDAMQRYGPAANGGPMIVVHRL